MRRRLGWLPGILNGPGLKPKGMHKRTYQCLTAEHDRLMGVRLKGVAHWLGVLDKVLGEARTHLDRAP